MKQIFYAGVFLVSLMIMGCKNNSSTDTNKDTASDTSNIKEEAVTYSADNVNMKGYVTYNAARDGKRPAVLIVHEWWGLGNYTRNRAKQLADLGYIAMAVDMYGEGKVTNDPKEAQALATPFYQNPQLTKTRLDAAIQK